MSNLTEDQIVDKLEEYYSKSLVERLSLQDFPNSNGKKITMIDDLALWDWAFSNTNQKGHTNNQHYYPDYLLKLGGKGRYPLNCMILPDPSLNTAKTSLPKNIKDPYKYLFSQKNLWSSDIEGWCTGVESICFKILQRNDINTVETLTTSLLDKNNDLIRFAFFFLTYLNIYRTGIANGNNLDAETRNKIATEEIMDPAGVYIKEIYANVVLLKSCELVHYHSEDIGLAYNKNYIKLIPRDTGSVEEFANRNLKNSLVAIPLSSKDLIFVLSAEPIYFSPSPKLDEWLGYKYENISNEQYNDWAFQFYNLSSLNESLLDRNNDKVFTNRQSILFSYNKKY